MKIIAVLFTALMLLSGSVFAKTVSATAATIDEAESKIATLAKKEHAFYVIISAQTKEHVYMVARLVY